jgi:Uncharacterised nucleotidyltransferase
VLETPLTVDRKWQMARTLQLDGVAIEIVRVFASADVPCLLLKGASVAKWLYPNEARPSIDVDIFVPRAQWSQAIQQIERVGFRRDRLGNTGGNWYRVKDRAWLDVHYTLLGLRVPPSHLWTTLWNERDTMELHGATIPILNERARLFHVVIHALQTGNAKAKAADDLARAIKCVSFEHWQQAWALARTLQADHLFATALRLYAAGGTEIADRLGAPRRIPFLQCVHAIESVPGSVALAELIEGRWQQRFALLKRWVWPESDYMDALEQGKVPQVPRWVRQCKSPYVRFYLWRAWQVLSCLRTWPEALRLRRSTDRINYRNAVSRPWRDDR